MARGDFVEAEGIEDIAGTGNPWTMPAFTAAVAAGDVLTCGVQMSGARNIVVSDNINGDWGAATEVDTTTGARCYIFQKVSAVATAGTLAITVSHDGADTGCRTIAGLFTCAGTPFEFDTSNLKTETDTAAECGGITTAEANELGVAYFGVSTNTDFTWDAPFVERAARTSDRQVMGSGIMTSAGANDATATIGSSMPYVGVILAFKAAAAAGGWVRRRRNEY